MIWYQIKDNSKQKQCVGGRLELQWQEPSKNKYCMLAHHHDPINTNKFQQATVPNNNLYFFQQKQLYNIIMHCVKHDICIMTLQLFVAIMKNALNWFISLENM